jgi:DNA-binding transcriptional MocR family regulator
VAADPVKYRQAFNYGGPEGSANLIAALRRFLVATRAGGLDRETLDRNRLIVGPCGATSLLDGISEVMERGIVVASDPAYYIYTAALERKGFEVLAVPEVDEGIDPGLLDRKLRALGGGRRRIRAWFQPIWGTEYSSGRSNRTTSPSSTPRPWWQPFS